LSSSAEPLGLIGRECVQTIWKYMVLRNCACVKGNIKEFTALRDLWSNDIIYKRARKLQTSKLTMMRIPDKGICYLMPLPKDLSAPDKLIGDLEKASQGVIDKGTRIDSTWMVNGELSERSFLSDDLQQFCTDFPIYLLKESRNSLAVIGIQEAEIANRLRRQAIPYVGKICDGGMDYDTALRFCDKPYRKCKVATRTCYKWVTCPGGGRSEAPPSS
ncbi:unnamed protein product, partial [Porites lobata]